MLYLIADHGGFELKNEIADWLKDRNIEFNDLGADSYQPEDDYPDYVKKLINIMNPQEDMAIALCASGQGICIALNRSKGVRATQAWSVESAKHARCDDNANILCLAGRLKNIDNPIEIVKTFLETDFKNEEKYSRRISKLDL